ncbi:hypothetical protein HK100_006250, partial [Physocladia obscura]
DAYHVICNQCAAAKNVCAKCQLSEEILPSSGAKTPAEVLLEKQNNERILSMMTERQRRSYNRKLERGDEAGAERIAALVASRSGIDDDDDDDDLDFDFSDNDDDIEDEESEEADDD